MKWVVYDTFKLGFIQNKFCSLMWIFIVKCGGLCKCVYAFECLWNLEMKWTLFIHLWNDNMKQIWFVLLATTYQNLEVIIMQNET
jgi:hypothetical protein